MKKIPLLTSEDIEVKIKQVTKTGALALLYKTARTDRRILNEVFGPFNWTSDYKVVKDNLYCGIGIREDAEKPFVWKWDCGVESGGDEDTAKKGEASDAFKRAGFAVGIGEELYSAPMIWLSVETVAEGNKYKLKDPYAKYVVTRIEYNEDTRVITGLDICNAKSNIKVFSWNMSTTGAMAKKMVNTLSNLEPTVEKAVQKIETPVVQEESAVVENTMSLEDLKKKIFEVLKQDPTKNKPIYDGVVLKVTGSADFKCNKATEDQHDLVLAIYNNLLEAVKRG